SGGQWRDWQRGVEDTDVEASGGIGREGWRTLSGGQRRDWKRGMEDTEWGQRSGREGWRT
ncbi:unnamed protein product, partial [Staurois parvus]